MKTKHRQEKQSPRTLTDCQHQCHAFPQIWGPREISPSPKPPTLSFRPRPSVSGVQGLHPIETGVEASKSPKRVSHNQGYFFGRAYGKDCNIWALGFPRDKNSVLILTSWHHRWGSFKCMEGLRGCTQKI